MNIHFTPRIAAPQFTHFARSAAWCAASILVMLAASPAIASCGSAFCTLMSDRYAQGAGEPHLGWSVDLRMESVSQQTLRSGTTTLSASQVTGEDAIERHTKNTNLLTTLSYGFDQHWSFALRIPVVKRDHLHTLIDKDSGLPGDDEQWRFTRVADVQAIARRQFVVNGGAASFALFGGLKLPTGSIDINNADGTRAERALQPGSGTTDVVFGVAARRALGLSDALIGQASVSQALNARENFKPGMRVEFSAGWSHAFSANIGSVVQLNLRHRKPDIGAQAEPANSGSTSVDVSPGITVSVGKASTLYAYLQVPVYQKVTGIQLVPRASFALGWTSDF